MDDFTLEAGLFGDSILSCIVNSNYSDVRISQEIYSISTCRGLLL